jgi:hypothetical protein
LNWTPAGAKISLFSKTHRLDAGTEKTPNQWVPGALPMEEKWPRRRANCLPPSNAEVNNEWGYTKIHHYALMACIRQPYLLTPWSRVLLEKLISSQLVKKLSALYGTQWFITTFTSFDRSHPVVLYNDKVIYSVKTQHILVINTINLATRFGSLNHLQANS